MTTITLTVAIISFALTAVVLCVNPRRPSNLAFSLVLLVLSLWLVCVYFAMEAGPRFHRGEENNLVFWLRINAAVVAFLPASLWLLTSAVTADGGKGNPSARSAIPVFLVSGLCISLTFSPSFVIEVNPHHLMHRGATYYVYNILSILVYLWCLRRIWRQLRSSTGIQRVELQFLALNAGAVAFLLGILNVIGNAFQFRALNRASILVVFAASVLTAWALLFHRVFNAREVILRLTMRAVVILGTGGSVFAAWLILRAIVSPSASVLLSAVISAPVAIWLEHNSRGWFGIDTKQRLATLRRTVIEQARTEPNVEQLVNGFCRLLMDDFKTTSATLLFEGKADHEMNSLHSFKDQLSSQLLGELGWATPESLERRRPTQAINELKALLIRHALALVVSVPRGSPTPSLIVALGAKTNEWPFTYPEVVRLQNIAELMDNILTHSRLTSQAALQAKIEHLAMMSRGLAHDLKNLITPVSSFLIHTDGRYEPDSAEAEVHAAARRSVRVMTDYVREALFFSERLQPKLESVALPKLFDAVRELTNERASARGVTVTSRCDFSGPLVADAVLLQRLLVNLVGNAIDASARGQTVTFSAREGREDWLQLRVTDDGCGIPAENLTRIFEPYFTTKQFGDDVRGFGLGLTICQKITNLHGGTISVQSQPGQGTAVTVELPSNAPSRRLLPAPPTLALP